MYFFSTLYLSFITERMLCSGKRRPGSGGIAYKTLDLLVKAAKSRGITAISLEATDMGRPLYEKYGFVKMEHEMELPE